LFNSQKDVDLYITVLKNPVLDPQAKEKEQEEAKEVRDVEELFKDNKDLLEGKYEMQRMQEMATTTMNKDKTSVPS